MEGCPACGTASPHHKRTRSSGEQRGITGKAVEPDEAAPRPFAQVSARTGRECSQLPKLRAQSLSTAAELPLFQRRPRLLTNLPVRRWSVSPDQ